MMREAKTYRFEAGDRVRVRYAIEGESGYDIGTVVRVRGQIAIVAWEHAGDTDPEEFGDLEPATDREEIRDV